MGWKGEPSETLKWISYQKFFNINNLFSIYTSFPKKHYQKLAIAEYS